MNRGQGWPGEPCASSTQMVRLVPRSLKGALFSRCTKARGIGFCKMAGAFLKCEGRDEPF